MERMEPFFLQYYVNHNPADTAVKHQAEGLATIIVFADCQETAQARCGRIISENNLQIYGFARVHLLSKQHIPKLDSVLRSIYDQAEAYGIALHCDFWQSRTGCCR